MAKYDDDNGILLSEEDKRVFKEINSNFQPNGKVRTPISARIMKWVLGNIKINTKEEN